MTNNKKWSVMAVAGAAVALAIPLTGCNPSNPGASSSGGSSGGAAPTDPIAVVNGENVTHRDLDSALEVRYGQQELPMIIRNKLVDQDLARNQMSVTSEDLAFEIAQLAAQNPGLQDMMKQGGPRADEATKQIKSQIGIEKLVTKDVPAKPDDVKAWFNKNQSYFQHSMVSLGWLFSSTKVRADVMEGELKSKSKTFGQLITEQKSASDDVAKHSDDTGQPIALEAFNPDVRSKIVNLKVGDISDVVTVPGKGTTQYAIVRLDSRVDNKVDFTKSEPQIELEYKISKLANMDPTDQYYAQVVQQTIQQKAAEALSTLATSSKIEVKDKDYSAIEKMFQAPPPGAAQGAPGPGDGAPSAGGALNAGGGAPNAGGAPSAPGQQ